MAAIRYTLNDDQLMQLGKIHSCFGTIEQLLQMIILAAYKLNITNGRMLVGRMDFQQKVEVLKEMAPQLMSNSKAAKQLEPLYSRIKSLAVQRNRLTHAAWSKSTKTNDAIAVAFKHWGKFDNMVRASKLPAILKEAEAVQNELFTVFMELNKDGYSV